MGIVACRSALVALVATASFLTALTAQADVVSGTVGGAQSVKIIDGSGNVVAELKPGPYQIVLPVGQFTAACGSGQPANPPDFLSLSTPVTVNFSCG